MDNNTLTYNLTHHLQYLSIPLDWDNLKPNKSLTLAKHEH
jgi:hypothetical protein